jgi:hypothetical protein
MGNRSALHALFVALVAASLVACSGGGGGMGGAPVAGNPGAGNPVTGAPGTGQSATTMTTKEQSVAGSALAVAGNSLDVDQFGVSGSATIFSINRAIAYHRDGNPVPAATPVCQNGVEFSQSGSNGQTMESIEFFYDQLCTQPRRLIALNISFTSSGGTASGTETLFDQSGNVVDVKTDNATFTLTNGQLAQITVQRSVAAGPSAAPFAQNGFTCVFGSGNPIDCGNATVATINAPNLDPHDFGTPTPLPSASPTASPTPFEIGFTGTVVGTQASPSPSPSAGPGNNFGGGFGFNPQSTQLQLTINGTGYTGATGSMTIAPATAPAWTVTGGTQVTTLTGTASIGFGGNGSFGSNTNLTLTDSADGLTIALMSQGRGGLTGTVTMAGQTVATVSVDDGGDGTINFTSGATAQIRDWVVLST